MISDNLWVNTHNYWKFKVFTCSLPMATASQALHWCTAHPERCRSKPFGRKGPRRNASGGPSARKSWQPKTQPDVEISRASFVKALNAIHLQTTWGFSTSGSFWKSSNCEKQDDGHCQVVDFWAPQGPSGTVADNIRSCQLHLIEETQAALPLASQVKATHRGIIANHLMVPLSRGFKGMKRLQTTYVYQTGKSRIACPNNLKLAMKSFRTTSSSPSFTHLSPIFTVLFQRSDNPRDISVSHGAEEMQGLVPWFLHGADSRVETWKMAAAEEIHKKKKHTDCQL